MAISIPVPSHRRSPNVRDGGIICPAVTRFTQRQCLRPRGRMGKTTNLMKPSGLTLGRQSTIARQLVVDGISAFSGIIMAMTVRWTTESLWVTDGLKECDIEKTSSSR